MDIYMMQNDHRSRYLAVINEVTYVSVYKYEKNKFDKPFLAISVFKRNVIRVKVKLIY